MTLNVGPYLEILAQAGRDVDQVVTDELENNKYGMTMMMWKYLRESSETWTGATGRTLFFDGPQRDGNYIFIEIGAHTDVDPSAWYKEYGTPRQAAEPFLRPTLQYYRTKGIKIAMGIVLESFGLTP